MSSDTKDEMLKDMLEKIIFDDKRLDELKAGILKFQEGNLTDKDLRQLIFTQHQDTFDELLDFFPFYVEHIGKSKKIDDFIKNKENLIQSREIEERDKYFIELLKRLQAINNHIS